MLSPMLRHQRLGEGNYILGITVHSAPPKSHFCYIYAVGSYEWECFIIVHICLLAASTVLPSCFAVLRIAALSLIY